MTQTSPPAGIRWGWLVAFGIFGTLFGYALHELAGFRPFVPPFLSGGISLACGDLDAYVQHVSDMSDHRIHAYTVGIHRQKTIDAVNELYDRARCQPKPDAAGHETYQKLPATVVEDVNDPGPHSALETPRGSPAMAAAGPASAPVAASQRPVVSGVIRGGRRHVLIVGDGTLDAMPPPAPLPCVIYKPGEINYGQPAGCR